MDQSQIQNFSLDAEWIRPSPILPYSFSSLVGSLKAWHRFWKTFVGLVCWEIVLVCIAILFAADKVRLLLCCWREVRDGIINLMLVFLTKSYLFLSFSFLFLFLLTWYLEKDLLFPLHSSKNIQRFCDLFFLASQTHTHIFFQHYPNEPSLEVELEPLTKDFHEKVYGLV